MQLFRSEILVMISESLNVAGQETWAVPGLSQSSSRSLGTGIVVLGSQMLLKFGPLAGAGREAQGRILGVQPLVPPGWLWWHPRAGVGTAWLPWGRSVEKFKKKIVKFYIGHMLAGVPAWAGARALLSVLNSALISVTEIPCALLGTY